jgi:predicted patatin/cPLA2 family phospholipase
MRALVISGGGARGIRWRCRTISFRKKKNEYDIFIGTSTGSLLIPHLALNKTEKIKRYLLL